jgi:hypothetical protein
VQILRAISAALLAAQVAGCGLVAHNQREAMSDPDLAALVASRNDKTVCYWALDRLGGRTGFFAQNEAHKRGLGDCSDDHFKCVKSYGVQFGTPEYSNCRIALDVNRQNRAAADDATNRAIGAYMLGVGQRMAQPPQANQPRTVTCAPSSPWTRQDVLTCQ